MTTSSISQLEKVTSTRIFNMGMHIIMVCHTNSSDTWLWWKPRTENFWCDWTCDCDSLEQGIRVWGKHCRVRGNLVTMSVWPGAYHDRGEETNFNWNAAIEVSPIEALSTFHMLIQYRQRITRARTHTHTYIFTHYSFNCLPSHCERKPKYLPEMCMTGRNWKSTQTMPLIFISLFTLFFLELCRITLASLGPKQNHNFWVCLYSQPNIICKKQSVLLFSGCSFMVR